MEGRIVLGVPRCTRVAAGLVKTLRTVRDYALSAEIEALIEVGLVWADPRP